MITQTVVTIVIASLFFFTPSAKRILSLKRSHRSFQLSMDNVARAKSFLRQRQEEAERQQTLIVEALHAIRDIRKWSQQVELEKSVVASQLSQLDEHLQPTLPNLGYTLGEQGASIVPLPQKSAAE